MLKITGFDLFVVDTETRTHIEKNGHRYFDELSMMLNTPFGINYDLDVSEMNPFDDLSYEVYR